MIPLAPIAAGVALCVIWRARPSTLLRVVEDTTIAVPKAIAKRAKRFKADLKIEYEARLINKLQEKISIEAATLRNMSEADRQALAKQQALIFARAEQLRVERDAKRHARSARGSDAHA